MTTKPTLFDTGRCRRLAGTDWPIYFYVERLPLGSGDCVRIFERCNGVADSHGPPILFDTEAKAEQWIADYLAESNRPAAAAEGGAQ